MCIIVDLITGLSPSTRAVSCMAIGPCTANIGTFRPPVSEPTGQVAMHISLNPVVRSETHNFETCIGMEPCKLSEMHASSRVSLSW